MLTHVFLHYQSSVYYTPKILHQKQQQKYGLIYVRNHQYILNIEITCDHSDIKHKNKFWLENLRLNEEILQKISMFFPQKSEKNNQVIYQKTNQGTFFFVRLGRHENAFRSKIQLPPVHIVCLESVWGEFLSSFLKISPLKTLLR